MNSRTNVAGSAASGLTADEARAHLAGYGAPKPKAKAEVFTSKKAQHWRDVLDGLREGPPRLRPNEMLKDFRRREEAHAKALRDAEENLDEEQHAERREKAERNRAAVAGLTRRSDEVAARLAIEGRKVLDAVAALDGALEAAGASFGEGHRLSNEAATHGGRVPVRTIGGAELGLARRTLERAVHRISALLGQNLPATTQIAAVELKQEA